VSLDPVVVAVGARARVAVTPASILRPALRLRATEIVLAHNNFAEARPGAADLAVTRRLGAAGALVGVPLRAHLVLGSAGW
jgi:DNA repair protein RadC